MNYSMQWDNLVAYSLQVGLLVGLTAFIPALLRLKNPKAKLYFWYLLLAACLALPALRPWKQEVLTVSLQPFPMTMPVMPATPMKHTMPRAELALLVLVAGAGIRLIWLGLGFWKLQRYRRHSRPLGGANVWGVNADLRISEAVASPVTFGFLDPVILLPGQFPELGQAKQDAILCHEVLHVWRHDWIFTIGEEIVRAVFWFHPAIWWLLGEIQLAREQAVDQQAIELTSQRDEYLDALLAIAGAAAQLDLAPAPLFLRKRHLKHRVVSILKEARMSKMRLISVFAMSLVMLAAACCFVTGAFPLAAAPQMITDGMGVTVEMNGASLIHRAPVFYPPSALRAHVEGIVMVQVKIGTNGEVTDANVMSGPDSLRKGVLTSVLDWHFTRDMANSTRQVTIAFQLPKADAVPQTTTITPGTGTVGVVGGVPGGMRGGVNGGVVGGVIGGQPSDKALQDARDAALLAQTRLRQPSIPGTIKSIDTSGLNDQVRTELLARLPFREGDTITNENFRAAVQAVHDYDEHMGIGLSSNGNGETVVHINTPHAVIGRFTSDGMMAAVEPKPAPPGSIRVGGNVQQAKLTSQVTPVYPALAKQARISGVVHLNALIAKDGTIKDLSVISGHPLLIQAAIDAVRQWTYAQTLLNGDPVEVVTQIDVNFTLSQ